VISWDTLTLLTQAMAAEAVDLHQHLKKELLLILA
jgi:hypothetical protein